jgi:hypothetical protein
MGVSAKYGKMYQSMEIIIDYFILFYSKRVSKLGSITEEVWLCSSN